MMPHMEGVVRSRGWLLLLCLLGRSLAGLQLRLEIRNTGSGDAQILVDDIELVRTAPAYRSDLTPAQTPGYDPAEVRPLEPPILDAPCIPADRLPLSEVLHWEKFGS